MNTENKVITYEYRAFSLTRVVDLFAGLAQPEEDGYISEDRDTKLIRSAINEGFRWVRTEQDMAIFERENRWP